MTIKERFEQVARAKGWTAEDLSSKLRDQGLYGVLPGRQVANFRGMQVSAHDIFDGMVFVEDGQTAGIFIRDGRAYLDVEGHPSLGGFVAAILRDNSDLTLRPVA